MNPPPRLIPPLVLVSVAGLACAGSGCAGPSSPTSIAETRGVVADYKQVYLTGSHIPVRVPTSATARILPTTSPLVILTPEEFSRALAPSTVPMR